MTAVPMQLIDNSVWIPAQVNGQPILFILDTGDAVGPVFNADDAATLALPQGDPLQVTGAGGAASGIYATTATIVLGPFEYDNETGAVDPNLEGPSLLGLPFFTARTSFLGFDFNGSELVIVP